MKNFSNIPAETQCSLEQELLTLGAQIDAATYRFIKLLARFDEENGWQGDGIKSFSHWLNWKLGMNSMMAREKVRAARALEDLPNIDAAFATGEISYTKVRALTRVAIPENEDYLLEIARHGTGALIEKALDLIREVKVDSTNVSAETNFDDIRANALVELARHYLEHPPVNSNKEADAPANPERYQVFLHLHANPGTCAVEDHHFVAPDPAPHTLIYGSGSRNLSRRTSSGYSKPLM